VDKIPVDYPDETLIREIVRWSLNEDLGSGDVTTNWTIPADSHLRAQFLVKAEGVLAGMAVARLVFEQVDTDVLFTELSPDGKLVRPGDIVAKVEGPGRAILTAERTALNFMQRMSGIATLTRRYVEAVSGSKAVILDTRKTAPGIRVLDKWAVRLGGGQNHRAGLYDMVLIKDNHLAACGGIAATVERVQAHNTQNLPVEVEVKDLHELREALALSVDRIMLDNMSLAEMEQAVRLTDGTIPLEASGNVNLETVAEIAATGVDYISSGRLTHSVKALDISLDLME
jgi:nicotinate-nucleotide pyrophosphorylase (carboxylating)